MGLKYHIIVYHKIVKNCKMNKLKVKSKCYIHARAIIFFGGMVLMKNIFIAILAALLCAVVFTGCGASMKDGTYKAEYSDFDSHGWKDYVEINIAGGKITGVDYDSVNTDGVIKSQDAEYKAAMEGVSGTYPEKFMSELENMLIKQQDPKMVDTIAGASDSSGSFKKLVSEAISKGAKKGNLDVVIVTK